MISGEFTLYGLEKHRETIDAVINSLNISEYEYDIKLLLTEALTNAFYHGNKRDGAKPIYLRYAFNGEVVRIEVEDCGCGFDSVNIPLELTEDRLLDEDGRGLFLVGCYCDKVDLKGSLLIMEKYVGNKH